MFGFRLLHWGPIVALSIIASITCASITCHLEWWPLITREAWINFVVFILWNVLTLYNFFVAAFRGPGHVPVGWKPDVPSDTQFLQYCQICEGFKAPRSHHCRKCQRCVMKMDHHCPWINNCVGHRNQANFIAFLFFAPIGCLHAICILAPALYRAINRHYYLMYGRYDQPMVDLSVGALIGSMLSIGLALGVVLAVGGLFVIQMLSVIRNETGIESWIKDKAEYREHEEEEEDFIYPYNIGRWKNLRNVLHFRNRPELDGIWWPVREGCHQYTFTIEQIMQKRMKRCRSAIYEAQLRFAGGYCPCSQGFKVCLCQPCLDEQRVHLEPGDRILVSRFRKHWLYGDKQLNTTPSQSSADLAVSNLWDLSESLALLGYSSIYFLTVKRERGWFPRRCAKKISEEHCAGEVVSTTQDGATLKNPVDNDNSIRHRHQANSHGDGDESPLAENNAPNLNSQLSATESKKQTSQSKRKSH